MKRVAIYVRVSTRDTGQDTTNQLDQLHEYARRREWDVVAVYDDHESGRKGRGERDGFDRMFTAASRREFDLVLFWSLDRFSREGIAMVTNYLKILDGYGVRWHSYREEYLNTDNDALRPLLIAIICHFAAYEAARISERTIAGLERTKRQGTKLGRPRVGAWLALRIDEAWREGATVRGIVTMLEKEGTKMSESTVRRIIKHTNTVIDGGAEWSG